MESSSHFSPSHVYDEILQLQRNLLAATTAKGPSDPAVRRLRTSIRDGYEALLLRAPASFNRDYAIEYSLWLLHHREIEGFRLKLRKLSTAASKAPPTAAGLENPEGEAHNTTTTTTTKNNTNNNDKKKNSNNDNNNNNNIIIIDNIDNNQLNENVTKKRKKNSNKEEPLLRALASFKSFLTEATGFFHVLYIKIRLQNGVTLDRLLNESDPSDEFKECMEVCHKILIYLGDLARYREFYAAVDNKTRDWRVAAAYYKQASVQWPYSGNPYHQLAVLCTYCGNSMAALYLNCRSLAAKAPFQTALDNLETLFDKNKHELQQAQLPKACVSDKKGSQTIFSLCFVELVRVLLYQPSANEINVAYDAAEKQLEQLFHDGVDSDDGVMSSAKFACDAPLALQVIIVLIFCMHRISGKPETVNQTLILTTTLIFAMKFCSMLTRVGEETEVIWSAYPVAVVLIEWLANHSESLLIIQRDKDADSSFSEFCEGVISLDDFLLSKFAVADEQRNTDLFEAFGKAQMEDHEIYGFIPLEYIHIHLDFKTEPRRYGIHDLKTFSSWKKRFTEALDKGGRISGESVSNAWSKLHDINEQKLTDICVAQTTFAGCNLHPNVNVRSLVPEASVRIHSGEQTLEEHKENAYDMARKRVKLGSVSKGECADGFRNFRMAKSSTSEHQDILPSVCLDRVTHVVPSSFMDSILDPKLRCSLDNAVRKNMSSLRCDGLLNYETQNPFILRLESLSEL